MRTIDEVIQKNIKGQYYGNRILLPFRAEVLKLGLDKNIIMDFSPTSKFAHIRDAKSFTEIYLCNISDIENIISKYEVIKMIVVENDKDIFDLDNHRKIEIHLLGDHLFEITELDKDILFIE